MHFLPLWLFQEAGKPLFYFSSFPLFCNSVTDKLIGKQSFVVYVFTYLLAMHVLLNGR